MRAQLLISAFSLQRVGLQLHLYYFNVIAIGYLLAVMKVRLSHLHAI